MAGDIEVTSTVNEPVAVTEPAITAERAARFHLGVGAWLAAGFLFMMMAAALLAPILPLHNPTTSQYTAVAVGPRAGHPLGTDELGRDILSRVIWGGRVSFAVGVGSTVVGAGIGTAVGLLAGFLGGWVDAAFMRVMDVVLAFPSVVLAMAVLAAVGPSLLSVAVVIGVLFIPAYARISRAPVLSLRQRDFVVACQAVGMSRLRIMTREVLPIVIPLMLNFGLATFGVAILIEGSLSFLGVSVPPPAPTWGGMIASGREVLATSPFVSVIPAAVLAGVVYAANVLGESLTTHSDSKAAQL